MQHTTRFLELVQQVKGDVAEITAEQLLTKLQNSEDFHLIDVREREEYVQGHIPGARHLSKGVIERDIENQIPEVEAEIIVYCSGGFRSVLAAHNLQQMGYQRVRSLQAGSRHWQQAGLPWQD
jgi:rhodanese-related sulfurtransferase